MGLECDVCHNVDNFYVTDGVTFCGVCGTESQDHGQQLVVEEETLGFDQTITKRIKDKGRKGRKGRKGHSKARQKYLNSFKARFTSLDAFSFILKRWTEEAILLGADESLRNNVTQLWARYLMCTQTAFVKDNEAGGGEKAKKGRGKANVVRLRYVGYRDMAMAIANRKRLLDPHVVSKKVKAMSRSKRRRKSDLPEEFADDDNSIEARRARRRKRRKFLDVSGASSDAGSAVTGFDDDEDDDIVSGNISLGDEDTTDVSNLSSSFFDSSGDDSFSLSLSSFSSVSATSTQKVSAHGGSATSSYAGSVAASDATFSSGDESEREEMEKQVKHHARILNRLTRSKNSKSFLKSEKHRPTYPRLSTVFGIFSLAVMVTKSNWMTLADLLFWADCDVISYATNVIGIPKQLRFTSRGDRKAFSSLTQPPLDHLAVRNVVFQVGSFMQLKTADFANVSNNIPGNGNCNVVLEVTARFLRELSLPLQLLKVIRRLVPEPVLSAAAAFKFDQRPSTMRSTSKEMQTLIPSLDVLGMSLILLVLKYLFVLDDQSEYLLKRKDQSDRQLRNMDQSDRELRRNDDQSDGELRRNENESESELRRSEDQSEHESRRNEDQSESELRRNEDQSECDGESFFDLMDWMELSKLRCYLAVKYSQELNGKYQKLMAHVEMSPATRLRKIQDQASRLAAVKEHYSIADDDETTGGPEADGNGNQDDAVKLSKLLNDLVVSRKKERSRKNVKELSLGYSDVPLHDFSSSLIGRCRNDRLLPEEEKVGLDPTLLNRLHGYHRSDLVTLDLGDLGDLHHDFVLVDLPPFTANFHQDTDFPADSRLRVGKRLRKVPPPNNEEGGGGKFKYWYSPLFRQSGSVLGSDNVTRANREMFGASYESLLLSGLPQNFGWILRYLAATVSSRTMEVYACLTGLEARLLADNPAVFGRCVATAHTVAKIANVPVKLC